MPVGETTGCSCLAPGQCGPFNGRAWLNTAHQCPLPRAAWTAAQMKAAPHRSADGRAVPTTSVHRRQRADPTARHQGHEDTGE
jgi:hypothetical protein